MKTKEEIIEEFKESLEKFRINPFLKGHVQAVVEEQYLEFKKFSSSLNSKSPRSQRQTMQARKD